MAITFPRSVAELSDLLPITRVDWLPDRNETSSMLGSGEYLTSGRGPVLWAASVEVAPRYVADGEALKARFNALDGSQQAFYLTNPMLPYPQEDATGTLLGVSLPAIASIAADRKTITVSGLPAGYMLSVGDFAHVDYGSPERRALLQIMEDATADGAGLTGAFEVRPHLRSGITAGLTFVLAKPAAKVKLVPGSLRGPADGPFTRIRFSAMQTLEAG